MKKALLNRILCGVFAVLLMVTTVGTLSADAAASVSVSPVISVSGLTKPTEIAQGDSFALKGTVSVNAGVVTKITATVTNRQTKKVVMSATVQPKLKSVNIRNTINKKVPFGKLPVGYYTLKVVVTAKCGVKTTSKTIINHGFTVSGKRPSLSIVRAVYPTTIKAGNKAAVRGVINTSIGKITLVTATVTNSEGKTMMKSTFKPNKSFFNLQYTVNRELTFGLLPAGSYTYKLVAKAVSGKYTTTTTLLNKAFTVE